MIDLENKKVVVLGLNPSGMAASRLMAQCGAKVVLIDRLNTNGLERAAKEIEPLKISVKLGVTALPAEKFDFAVVSPEVLLRDPFLAELKKKEIQTISELELGYQQSLCLNIAVTGTNGKTTNTQIIERVLTHCHRKTVVCDETRLPLSSVAAQTKELDFVTLEVSSFQLEHTQFFRPTIAVLLNTAQDHLDRYASMTEYVQTKARIFANQQSFDWAIVQSESLAQLRALNLPVPAKVITFSANNRNADIFLDRGLIVSRLEDWAGPLLDMDHCKIRGPHNAESLMAALAVCRVLRLPLEQTAEALKNYELPPHRCEVVAEVNGVKFINDSKSTNVGALHRALISLPEGRAGEPNVWLIAGGRDKKFDFHDIGPLLSQRVKGAFLIGEAREKIRAAWSLFTPCTLVNSLLEAVPESAKNAVPGDVVLLSPACSSFDQFRNYQHRGEVYRDAVAEWARTTDCVSASGNHKGNESKKSIELSRQG
ncbi:MAG: UDP-N-acetylmuramoyl-L-alanine--D-glutamate ligase [Verrucomicrobiota bacterium]